MSAALPAEADALAYAHYHLAQRYEAIIARQDNDPLADDMRLSLRNLAWMCETIQQNLTAFPVDKLSRWLGFVQGCLAMRGLIDVDEERACSRSLFHAAYRAAGQAPPVSHSIE